jgi:succinate dehydrogenase / fumarate reductase membrane anchor subunit
MRSPSGGRARPSSNLELYAWYFMRISGVVLILLVLGHLVIMHLIFNVDRIDWEFVAGRYMNPLWRIYDLVMVILAVLHGSNGLRTVLDDYIHSPGWRTFAQSVLCVCVFVVLVIGTYTILSFDPTAFARGGK